MFDYPTPLTGDTRRDLERLWDEMFRLIEELRLLQEELARRGEQRDGEPVPYGDQR
jgi:hypothetical protein